MKKLPIVRPSAEQLRLISESGLGVEVIRGAAGSGKTSTAILRLQSLAYLFEERRQRQGRTDPVRILVLTFNRTLAGYVRALVSEQTSGFRNTLVEIDTFGRWAMKNLGYPDIIPDEAREAQISKLASGFSQPSAAYLIKEVDYLQGRFKPSEIESYITTARAGRGVEPRVDATLRRRILDEIVSPYRRWLGARGQLDWNDVAVGMASHEPALAYDIVIIDESQDFSANQLRAVRAHVAEEHAVTFVIDTVQRIYARGFTWAECGFDMRQARYHTLQENHRNTAEIAAFAAGILDNMPVEADGALPNLAAATVHGSMPAVLSGFYGKQVDWAIQFIRSHVNLELETVAFLSPRSGGFFSHLRVKLRTARLPFVEITRESEWPEGPTNIALSTFHSAKGLEFDHVFILGLSDINTSHGAAAVDDELTVLRRLLAVAVARARKTVVVGYKPGEESSLISYLKPATFRLVRV
jgi:DNA helicase IV